MHARAAVFDLYGDHLSRRDDWAPIAAVVRLLGAVELRPEAVRTAVSRLAREHWLEPVERHGVRGYSATPRARRRLAEAWTRIYRSETREWDGHWDVVVLPDRIADRSRRTRLAESLGFLGYARLAADAWIAPRPAAGLEEATGGITVRRFTSTYEDDGRELAGALWDLDGLARDYSAFIAWAEELAPEPDRLDERASYAVRAELVHTWRKFLFRDPGLPDEVLPTAWSGHAAAATFDRLSLSLLDRASAYVDDCLEHPHGHDPQDSRDLARPAT